ncbi:MAG: ABC transporter ATP-binding protein, partial [Spirillospora sp.]
STTGAEILDLLRESVSTLGQTIVMVTHDPSAAARADHVITLTDGRVLDRQS